MTCSVIVCTRNRPEEVKNFSDSLLKQTFLIDEFLIIDSSDQPFRNHPNHNIIKAEAESKGIAFVCEHTLPGLTLQRNIGIGLAKGDVLFFFDDDIVLNDIFVRAIMRVFKENTQFMAGMGRIINLPDLRLLSILFKKLFLMSHTGKTGKFQSSGLPVHPYETKELSTTKILSGAMTAYRKKVFEHLKFDDKLTGYSYMEDCDFSKRLTDRFDAFYEPEATCYHYHSESGRMDMRANRRMYTVNHRYFFEKNFRARGEGNLLAHYWSISGILLDSLLFRRSIQAFLGVLDGLLEYIKTDLSGK